MIAQLCISAAVAVLFCWHETRTAHPWLDLRHLRVPQFLTVKVLAFRAHFATFAIFFFTALLMTVTSLLAGRWTSAAGPASQAS